MVSGKVAEGSARLVVSRGGTLAEMVLSGVPEGPDAAPVSIPIELCFGVAAEFGLRLSTDATAALKVACANLEPGEQRRVEVARGTPPRHAEHGRVQWAVRDEPSAPTPETVSSAEPGTTEGVDHYARSAFAMVKQGDVLGRLIPPTPGEDGVDVTGRTLAARTGHPARLRLDDSILADAAGNLIAQREGVLSISNDRATVSDLLDIPEYVDFSTGHIDFPGEVRVRRGVRDLFRVTASAGITIEGLVESAQLESGATIRARGGLAGRGRGELLARADLEARYISGFTCRVLGSLRFDREIIDSRVEVLGSVESPNGSVIGGTLSVVASVSVGTLGAPSEAVTRLVVGAVPSLEPRLNKLEHLIAELTEKSRRDQDELKRLSAPGRRLSGPDKERFTELSYAVQTALVSLGKAEQARERLRQVIAGLSTVDVRVASEVHPGVVFRHDRTDFRVRARLKGPIRITRSAGGDLMLRQGEHAPASPLAHWCDRRAAA